MQKLNLKDFINFITKNYPQIFEVPGVNCTDTDSPSFLLNVLLRDILNKDNCSHILSSISEFYNCTDDYDLKSIIQVEVFDFLLQNKKCLNLFETSTNNNFLRDFIVFENEWINDKKINYLNLYF